MRNRFISLYEAYGGRIIYQQLGPEPLDACRQYLEERQKAGDFRIDEPAMKWEWRPPPRGLMANAASG